MNNNLLKNLAVWLLIGFLVFLIIDFYKTNNSVQQSRVVSSSNFLSDVKNGNISRVEIRGNNITGEYSNGTLFSTYAPNDLSLIDKLEKNNIEIIAQPLEKNSPGLLDIYLLVSNAPVNRSLDIFGETNAIRKWKSNGLWKIQS